MKKFLSLLLTLLMVFALVSCGQSSEPSGDSEGEGTVEVVDVDMQYITADDLKAAMDDYLIVDVRIDSDYAAAAIPGSVGIDMDAAKNGDNEAGIAAMKAGLKKATGSETGGDEKIVLVCYSGKSYAQAATNILAAIGANMDNVYTLEGGFNNWKEVYASDVERGDVAMNYITAEDLKAAIDGGDDSYLVLDVRMDADYQTSHIPGAVGIDMDAAKNGDFEAGVSAMKAGLSEATGSETGGEKTLVLVCYSGKSYAQAATNVLYSIGANMDNVLTLEGGFNNWSSVYADAVE